LTADSFVVREAAPDPPPGPERDAIITMNEAAAHAAENAVTGVLERHLERVIGVVLQRARGPKARKGTKWWVPSGTDSTLEVKDLDTTYVVPDKLTNSLADDIRPVILTIATDAAADTAQRLGEPEDIASYDTQEIERAVDEAIKLILGIADRHIRELRQAVLDADSTAGDLDDLLGRIEKAHRKGGNWVLMAGRTLANALANDAAYEQALRLGCTHAQWVSRRDGRVRPTHVRADGQVRRMEGRLLKFGTRFKVGKFRLRHPCDPSGLPLSWPEVAGCRCKLLFRRPGEKARALFEVIDRSVRDGSAPRRAIDALAIALATATALPDGAAHTPTPQGYPLAPAAPLVTLPEPVVGYRLLPDGADVIPGQQITMSSQLVLGLDWKGPASALMLAVLVPAGTVVAATGGAIILSGGTTLEILGAGETGVRAQVVA
jgi:hypothetical protein